MKTFQLRGTQVQFPAVCVVCVGTPYQEHKIERTFTYGRRSILLSLPVPLCQAHYETAARKSKAQIGFERFSPIVGCVLGLSVVTSLLRYWSASGQGSLVANILIALLAGASVAVTLWAVLYFWLTPAFASSETKSVLQSVQLTRYDPFRQVLEIRIMNDTVADLTVQANLPNLITN